MGGEHLANGAHRLLGTALLDEADHGICDDDGEDHRRVGHMPKARRNGCGTHKHIDEHIVEMREEAKDRALSFRLGQPVQTMALKALSCLFRAQPSAIRRQRFEHVIDVKRVRLADLPRLFVHRGVLHQDGSR